MRLEKNWFYNFCVSLSIVGLLYIIISGFSSLGAGQEYSYFFKGVLILVLFGLWTLINFLAVISAKFSLLSRFSSDKKWVLIAEGLVVVAVMVAAFLLRLMVIQRIPMQVASDYKTYYEIADLLKQGNIQEEGEGYCNYIAMFPHVMGYSYILKTVFNWFGTSVLVGQYLNIGFSMGTIWFVYRIGRRLGGRIGGFISLIGTAFWPSQVLYLTMLSAEYAFTFFLFTCISLFLYLNKDYGENTGEAAKSIALYMLLGVFIAITAAIRPMALILLVGIIICLFPQKMRMPHIPKNDMPLILRFLEKGWLRCVVIIIPYLIISSAITTNIELTVDRTLPSSSTSFGYNLLVGLNADSKGGWNDADAKLLYDTMEATGSATQAHITCRNLAFIRLTSAPEKIVNLFVEKYELLWGNDDYGATWNISFLREQGNLTKERSNFLYAIRDYNNIIYLITIFFGIIALIYLLAKEGSYAYILILMYLGTVAMHLMVESQNRYHYFVIQVFIILSGMGIHFIFENERGKVRHIKKKEQKKEIEMKLEKEEIEIQEAIDKKVQEIRKEVMSNTFDMAYALKNRHVTVTVSEVYADEAQKTETDHAMKEDQITTQDDQITKQWGIPEKELKSDEAEEFYDFSEYDLIDNEDEYDGYDEEDNLLTIEEEESKAARIPAQETKTLVQGNRGNNANARVTITSRSKKRKKHKISGWLLAGTAALAVIEITREKLNGKSGSKKS